MANTRRDFAKERFWRDVLARQAASGLSVPGFCRRETLAESAFYFWRREIAERHWKGKRPARAKPPTFLPVIVGGGE